MVDSSAFERLLRTQRELVTRAQALAHGFSDKQIRLRRADGRWRSVFGGVYLTSAFPLSFEQWGQAALLLVGERGHLAGPTAARLHSLDGFRPHPKKPERCAPIIHVTVPHQQKLEGAANLVVHRTSLLDPTDFTTRMGLPCTTVVRTVVDLAPQVDHRSLVMAFEDAIRRGHRRWLTRRAMALNTGLRGLAPLFELLSRRGGKTAATDSAAEAICDDILWRGGLQAIRQFPLHDGKRWARVDLAFPAQRVAIEVDGGDSHDNDPAFHRDRDRDGWAAALDGWQTLRFTWKHLYDEAELLRRVRRVLEIRTPWLTAAAHGSPRVA